MATAKKRASQVLSAEEKAAMAETIRERRSGKADTEEALLEKIAEMPPGDREIAEKIHAIVKVNAPHLQAKTWYGMPAYAKDGKVLCFFQPASKFKARYSTLGFNDPAELDDGNVWPTSFAIVKKLSAADEKKIAALVKKAAS
jgi:uncharacterized protein YdhG (YjbR/CyaY superfamily)